MIKMPASDKQTTLPAESTGWLRRAASKLYNWVALMIVVGAVVGHFWPAVGVAMQPVAEGFINLIKMLIPPVILCTVVLGIAGAGGIRKAGRVGAKALIYFEVVSTFALVMGLVMAHWFGPGRSFHANPSQLDPEAGGRLRREGAPDERLGSPAEDDPADPLQRLHRGRHPPGAAGFGAAGLRADAVETGTGAAADRVSSRA